MAVETLDFPATWPAPGRPGVYPIPLVKKTVTAFVGRTERGPVNEPVRIRDYAEFARIFGGQLGSSTVPRAVQDYFLHGGTAAVVVRVANRATRARIDVPAGRQFLHLEARHPGKQEVLRVSVDYDKVQKLSDRFNLVIQRLRNNGSALIADQELYPVISMNHKDDRFVVDALKDSRLVRLSGPLPGVRPNETPAEYPGQAVKYIGMTSRGSDGDELTDYDIIGSNREGTGLFALVRAGRIDLLCIPSPLRAELGTTAYVAAERFCEKQRAMLIWDPPWRLNSADSAVMDARRSGRSSQNVMTYYPRVRPRGEDSRLPEGLPACGAVAGMLARQDLRGTWKSATAGALVLKSSFTPTETLDEKQASLLQRAGVNTFVRGLGGTFALTGNVTSGGPGPSSSGFRRLSQRRLSLFILGSIEDSTAWVRYHLDDDETQGRLEHQVRAFLDGLYGQGALAGNSPVQAYAVDVERTPPPGSGYALRFGFALDRPADLALYEMAFGSDGAHSVRPVPTLEAGQLFR